ncbi:MAG: helix-turn-helix domain-containing protein [Aigarchaeota archaeon]|nr:helix-turn-helix domain-containing protein [Aigarchaeota archaeon]
MKDKALAAKLMLPLIEFEFGFLGDDKPTLVQSRDNIEQMRRLFAICRRHGWTTRQSISFKRGNPYFRLSTKGFLEIHGIAGPFADPRKEAWAKLMGERAGKIGGFKGNEVPTQNRILSLMIKYPRRKWNVEEICLEVRILPSSVREALRRLEKSGRLKRMRKGKSTLYSLRTPQPFPETLPGATAG